MVRAAFAAHSGCRHRTPRNGRGTSVSVRELSRTDRAHLCENACASHPMSPISIFEKFNHVRNNDSLAHDNDLLGHDEGLARPKRREPMKRALMISAMLAF